MLLASIGDAIGYKRGSWEFNEDGPAIHKQMMDITKGEGVLSLQINKRNFPYSDDTVMHFATAKGLLAGELTAPGAVICQNVGKQYKLCWKLMGGRAAGMTCKRSIDKLYFDGSNWDSTQFDKNGGGCGASMRAACIGLVYSKDIKKLVQISIQTGRTTHHNPLGYLGSLVSAYFTSLAIRGQDPNSWLFLLFKQALPLAQQYISRMRESQVNLKNGDWQKFVQSWKDYAQKRSMSLTESSVPSFPQKYGVEERELFYKQFALNGWPGALGIDSVIIAYDALLWSGASWQKLCLSSMLHGGDSDSTGTIAAAWFGALHAMKGIPELHTEKAQGKDEAIELGSRLFDLYSKTYN